MRTPASKSTLFRWSGVNSKGKKVRGLQESHCADSLRQSLAEQRIRARRIHRVLFISWHKRPLSGEETALFTRQLASMLQAGVALTQALILIQSTCTQERLHFVITSLLRDIQAGMSLHQALARTGMCDLWLIHIVHAAESSGQLDQLLLQQAVHREQLVAQQNQLRTALSYPLFVLVISVGATLALLHWVVPTFEDVFSSFGAQLPWLTIQILAASQWIQNHGLWSIGLFIAVLAVLQQGYRRITPWREHMDRWILYMPWLAHLIRQAHQARWCTTLHALMHAGIPIDQALTLVRPLIANSHYQHVTTELVERMKQGQSLSQAMSSHHLCFDPLSIQMCALGEESGTLADMIERLANHYEQQLQFQVKRLSVLIEPAIMSFLGILVGGLIAALYLPIFQMGQIL